MKLFTSPASPFVRKARILVREKNILAQVQEIMVMPTDNPPELVASNPIAQIPCLVLDDGKSVFHSSLICQYIDAINDNGGIICPNDLGIKRLEIIGDAILEMIVKMVLENRRPVNERSPTWLKRWEDNIKRTIDFAENEISSLDLGQFNIGIITIAVAVTYLEFRYPHIEWKDNHPNLVKLQENMEKRQSFIDTYPR